MTRCRFGDLGSGVEEVGLRKCRRALDEKRGHLFDGFVREDAAVDVRDIARLTRHRLGDLADSMSGVDDKRAPDGVEVAPVMVVEEPAPLTTHDFGVFVRQVAIKDGRIRVARHGANVLWGMGLGSGLTRSEVWGLRSEV